MAIKELLKKYESICGQLSIAVSEDDETKVYDLDQALSYNLREILTFEPHTPEEKELLLDFLIELLVPVKERSNFQSQVIQRLKRLV